MITLTKTDNSVQVVFSTGEVFYLRPDTIVFTRQNENRIFVVNETASGVYFKFKPTDINGRPNDDLEDVAEFLRDTYFTGLTVSGGGGSWPVDYATSGNQTTQITELNNIETDLEALVDKTPTDLVTEIHDYKEIVYSGSDIDYISYKTGGSGGSEVARVTFTYNGNGDITGIAKT